jgi:hypothetical protein
MVTKSSAVHQDVETVRAAPRIGVQLYTVRDRLGVQGGCPDSC